MADQSLLDDTKKPTKEDNSTVEPAKKQSPTVANASPLLKRAAPRDLPSYPSHGIQNWQASAGKAALLASQSKSPDPWKPDRLPAAGTAATLAHTMKSADPWVPGPQPTATAAALLAGDARKVPDAWQPPKTSKSASKAASSVKEKKTTEPMKRSPPPQSASKAVTAASMASSYPKPAPKSLSTSPPSLTYDINKVNAVALQNAQMRLSSPSQPRALLSQTQTDKNNSDTLRAATISMAKNTSKSPPKQSTPATTTPMPPSTYYSHIPTSPPKKTPTVDPNAKVNRKSSMQAASLAASSDLHSVVSGESAEDKERRYYPHLEEAARKAASERLARLQAEHDRARKASGLPPNWQPGGAHTRSVTSPPRNKPVRPARPARTQPARPRQPDATDYARSMKIKTETAKLTKQIDSVDKDRQARDYLALMAAAEKNVKSRMQDLETKVAEDQGRVPKHLQAQWDAKAKMLSEESDRKRNAEKESKKGKIDMGGGLWYDQEDLERIARGNVQPILDEINVKAEKERARLEALRLEKEQQERERKTEAERIAGTKAETRKAKVLEKAAVKSRREAEKAEERQRKAELKESQRQEKERIKTEKQKVAVVVPVPIPTERAAGDGEAAVEATPEEGMEELEPRPMSQAGHERVDREREMHEASKKERGWFGSIQKRFIKRAPGTKKEDKPAAVASTEPMPQVVEGDEREDSSDLSSISSLEKTSVRDVALAGTASGVSSDDEDEIVPDSGAGLEAIEAEVLGGHPYVDSDSSTSSDDLYTTSPSYKPLTSATYAPAPVGEELVMQAFVEGRRYSTSTDSSDEGLVHGEQTFGEGTPVSLAVVGGGQVVEKDTLRPPTQDSEKHGTFGDKLVTQVKKSFEEFSKEDMAKEEAKEKEEARKMNEPAMKPDVPTVELSSVEETKGGPRGSAAEGGGVKLGDELSPEKEKRLSRFSEIL
ncbi:hypothetical protein ABW20_dc0106399 [Dactylellina cionopaga]|nr:hypothetical protein ABW20_dc0106399 [Dactylellina cionopaga]